MTQKRFFLLILVFFHSIHATSLAEQFKQTGYIEIDDERQTTTIFNSLYTQFDELINFFQTNPIWAQKLSNAKERFIRSNDRNLYSTDFFGLYDESKRKDRNQISFYYSTHFHEFVCCRYPEFNRVPEIIRFFELCHELQEPYANVFNEVVMKLGLETIYSQPPVLFKVIKYLPSYTAKRPHYDGTAFSLFLDSTDNEALLLSPYKSSFAVDDFSSPLRRKQNSIILIPGALLTEFFINPTPHIVLDSGKIRYATIAFAMRPNYIAQKTELSPLPSFSH